MDSALPPFSISAWTFDGSYRTQNSVGNPSEHGPSRRWNYDYMSLSKKASVQPRRSEVVCAGCHFLVPR